MSRYRDAALFCLLALFWGGSFVAIEVGLTALPPVLLAGYRFDLAALLMLAYVATATDRPVPADRTGWAAVLVGALLLVAVNAGLLFVGQQHTTGGVAAIVYSLNPILTTAFAALLVGGERLDPRGYLGVALGVLGVGFIARPDLSGALDGTVLGVALVFGAAVSVSLGSVLVRRLDATLPSVTLTAWSMAGGAVALHLLSLARGEAVALPAGARVLVALAFLGVFSSAVAYTIYFTLLARVGAFQANLVSYVVPVVATTLGWALLEERVSALTLVGFLLILVGFLLVKREAVAAEVPRVKARLPF